MGNEKRAGVANRRVYSYVADDGTVFFSFTKTRQTVSTGKRLILQNRNGTPLLPFMVFMRDQVGKEASVEDDDVSQLGKTKQTKGQTHE